MVKEFVSGRDEFLRQASQKMKNHQIKEAKKGSYQLVFIEAS
jgi:hypothetical protein